LTFLTPEEKILWGDRNIGSETVTQTKSIISRTRDIYVATILEDPEELADLIQYYGCVLKSYEVNCCKRKRIDITESLVTKKRKIEKLESVLNACRAIDNAYKRRREERSESPDSDGVKRVAR
jgi:hypothetical protein